MSRKNEHKKEMEAFRRKQRLQQQENAAATAGGALKNTSGTGTVTVYNTPAGITPFGLNPGLRIENSILDETKKQQEYSGFADTFAQKAIDEELLGNYPDSRYLWGQAAEMDKKSKDAGAKAEFFREVVRNPAALFAAPNSAPKPAKPETKTAAKPASSTPSGTYADRETVQLQIDRVTKEKQDYITASGGKGDNAVLSWYDNQLRDLYSAKSALPTEATREDILLQALGGNYYTGERTPAGTALEIGLGLTPFGFITDSRDLIHDWTNSDAPLHQKLLSTASILPGADVLKHTDDAKDATKLLARTAGNIDNTAVIATKQASMTTEPLSDTINVQRKAELMDTIKENLNNYPLLPYSNKNTASHTDKILETTVSTRYSNPTVTWISPTSVRFSQKTVNGSLGIMENMKINGWHGEPIDVVLMPDGVFTAVDNTRLRAAKLSNTTVPIRIHDYNEPFPMDQLERFDGKKSYPTTWGDAINIRIDDQGKAFKNSNPCGTFMLPRENNYSYTKKE